MLCHIYAIDNMVQATRIDSYHASIGRDTVYEDIGEIKIQFINKNQKDNVVNLYFSKDEFKSFQKNLAELAEKMED